METETVDNDIAAHIEGSRTDTDSVYRDTETNFNIYLITHNVEEPIKDDKEEEEADAWEEKKPKTNKVEKITWDWELCNSSKPIWIRKPNDIEQDEYDEFYKSITKDKNGPIKTSSSGRSSPPKSSSESLRIPPTKLAKMLRFTSSSGRLTSLDEYVKRMKDKQKSIYYISGGSKKEVSSSPFVKQLLKKDYEVVFLTEDVDEYATSSLPEF